MRDKDGCKGYIGGNPFGDKEKQGTIPIWSDSITHALVYIGQELGQLNSNYEFDFTLNIPFSEQLEVDLLIGNFTLCYSFIERITYLLTPQELRDMARVLYLRKRFPTLSDNTLKCKALDIFYMPEDRFNLAMIYSKDFHR